MNEQEITAPEIAPEAEEQTEAMPAEASAESAAEASAGTEAGTGPDAEALTVEELGLSERAAGTETEDTRLKAIIEAAIYITHTPCIHCFKVLLNTGITRICFDRPYKLDTLAEMRSFAPQVELIQIA